MISIKSEFPGYGFSWPIDLWPKETSYPPHPLPNIQQWDNDKINTIDTPTQKKRKEWESHSNHWLIGILKASKIVVTRVPSSMSNVQHKKVFLIEIILFPTSGSLICCSSQLLVLPSRLHPLRHLSIRTYLCLQLNSPFILLSAHFKLGM